MGWFAQKLLDAIFIGVIHPMTQVKTISCSVLLTASCLTVVVFLDEQAEKPWCAAPKEKLLQWVSLAVCCSPP